MSQAVSEASTPVGRATRGPDSPRGTRRGGRSGLAGRPVWWLLPTIVVLALVFVYPIAQVVRLSFTDANLVGAEGGYTLTSYRHVLSDLGQVLGVTAVFVLGSVVFQMLLGFFIALLIDEAGKRRLHGVVLTRTAVMTAWAIPGVVIGIIWKLMYQESDSGILNYLFAQVGLDGNVPFLSSPHAALVSVTVANIWRGTALSMILCYAGLKTIPQDTLEAAHLDGAGPLATLRSIILPQMRPVLTVNLIIVTVETLNTFDMVQALTAGGPGTSTQVLALGIYSQVFGDQALGRGAALSVALLVINMVIVFGYLRFLDRQRKGA